MTDREQLGKLFDSDIAFLKSQSADCLGYDMSDGHAYVDEMIASLSSKSAILLAQLDAARAEVERLRAVVWDTLQTLQRVPVDLAVSGEVSRAIREHRLALKGFGDGLSAPTKEEP